MPLSALQSIRTQSPDGRIIEKIGINPIKRFVRGYWVVSDPLTSALAAQGTAGDSANLRFSIDTQGHFDWAYVIGNSTAAFSIEFYDAQKNRLLQNRPVHSSGVVGPAIRPFRLPKPYFFNVGDSEREITAVIRNLSPLPNTVRISLYGRRFYHKEMPPDMARDVERRFDEGEREYSFWLVPKETAFDGTVPAIAAGARATLTFETDNKADIEIDKVMLSSDGLFDYQLRCGDRSLKSWSNGDVESSSGFGDALFPFILGDSFLLERKRQILLEIRNTGVAPISVFATASGKQMQYR